MSPRKTYILKLYVAGNTPNSMRALKTLRNILETEFRGVYALKVIDVLKNPQLAEEDKILATPTLSKILPPPVRRIIGDLSDRERVLIGLDLLYDELSDTSLNSSLERLSMRRPARRFLQILKRHGALQHGSCPAHYGQVISGCHAVPPDQRSASDAGSKAPDRDRGL